jgi:hypothetical protein
MIDYIQANKIRRKYPKRLSRENIDSIIQEWMKEGVDQEYMLKYSSMFDIKAHKLNVSEKELTLRAIMNFNFASLEPYPIDNRNFYGMLAVMHFENLTGYRDAYEIPKKEYKLRIQIGKEYLQKCAELDKNELARGFSEMRKIREDVDIKYPREIHSYQKMLDEAIDEILEEKELTAEEK